jgi:hypothetical protein
LALGGLDKHHWGDNLQQQIYELTPFLRDVRRAHARIPAGTLVGDEAVKFSLYVSALGLQSNKTYATVCFEHSELCVEALGRFNSVATLDFH